MTIYGHTYGGDNAVNLAEEIPEINVHTMIIVDSSDGPLRGLTVNHEIPNNVDSAYNYYQENYQGTSSSSATSFNLGKSSNSSSDSNGSESSDDSGSGSSNSLGSRGYPHASKGKANVSNFKIENVDHSTIQRIPEIKNKIKERINESN